MSKMSISALIGALVISLIANVYLGVRVSDLRLGRPLVTVGDQRITKYDYQLALEQAAGGPILKKIVYTALVRQAAEKAGVEPKQADVDARIADLQQRAPQVAAQATNPATAVDFRNNLMSDMALENLRIIGVTASDAEINAFYNRNKSAFSMPAQVQSTMVVSQNQADADTATHLLQQDVKPEIIASQPRLHVAGVNGFNVNMSSLPPTVRQLVSKTVLAMGPGQIKTLPVGKYFLTFKVKAARATTIPPLSQIHDQVERQVKLQKAISPQAELATLYANNAPTFNVQRYANYFQDVQSYNAHLSHQTASAQ